jgi:hypothetical protein
LWSAAEKLTYDIAKFVTEAHIVTGTSRSSLKTNYGQPDAAPLSDWMRLGVPKSVWKIIFMPHPTCSSNNEMNRKSLRVDVRNWI